MREILKKVNQKLIAINFTSFILVLLFIIIPNAEPSDSILGVGCPLGKISLFINNNGNVESGYFYDINYTYKSSKYFNIELTIGSAISQASISSNDKEGNTKLSGNMYIVSLVDQINIYRSSKHEFYPFFGIECLRSDFKVSKDPIYSFGSKFGIGYEFSLTELLSIITEIGYRKNDFNIDVSIDDLNYDGYIISLGLKAYLPL